MKFELSEQQLRAIRTPSRRVLVVAGPGSGKSEVLINRIVMRAGLWPTSEMVVLTFTHEAAGVLRRRLAEHQLAPLAYIGTRHGYCLRLLQKHGHKIGYGPRILVLTENQSDELLKSAAALLNYKGSWKQLVELREREPSHLLEDSSLGALVVKTYYRLLKQSDSLDYHLMLTEGFRLIKVLESAQELPVISDLFVDEKQDDSSLDSIIDEALPAENRFYVGDPDQAIYGFRGGSIDGILKIAADSRWELIRLEENYRSGSVICNAAQNLIENNLTRVVKRTIATGIDCGFITCFEYLNGEQEELQIMIRVQQKLTEKTTDAFKPRDIAVLARTNTIVDNLLKIGEALGLPVNKRRPMPTDWHYACLTVDMLVNPHNDLVFSMWLHEYCRTRGNEGDYASDKVSQLRNAAEIEGIPMVDKFGGVYEAEPKDLLGLLEIKFGVSPESIFIIRESKQDLDNPSLAEIALAIRRRNDEPKLSGGDGITITTLHGAKGREWDVVFIVGADQNLIPGKRKDLDIEAERRLFYVAVTRAKRWLYISHARERKPDHPYAKHEASLPSQFIAELRLQQG